MSAVPEPSRQRELELELQQWQALLASDPEEPNAWVRLGMAHFKLAQIQESIQAFDQAAALEPAIAPLSLATRLILLLRWQICRSRRAVSTGSEG